MNNFMLTLSAVLLIPTLATSQDCIDYGDYLHWVGAVDTPGAVDVAVAGKLAYVADYDGLQVLDISVPESPVIVGAVGTPDYARGIAVTGNYAYVADRFSGLQVLDISVPGSPVIVGAVDTPDRADDVAVSGNYAYVSDQGSGLQVIDISVPGSPMIVGSVDTPGTAGRIAVAGNYAYVADGSSGLQIAWRQCGEPSAVEPEFPEFKSHLFDAYPNPFNPQTTIAFDMPKQEAVRLAVYDVSGRLVDVLLDGDIAAPGRNEVVWRGRDMAGRVVSAGVYFYRLEAGEYLETKRMVLVK